MQTKIPKTLNSSCAHHGKVFDLIIEDIEYPSGRRGIREIARHNGGSVIVPLFDNGDILLVRQYRQPFHKDVLELPAGKLEPNEDPLLCAQRELQEETGLTAEKFEKLTAMYSTPGFCSEILHIYLATGITQSPKGQALEEGELSLTLERYPLAAAVAMVEREEIVDGKSIAGILMTNNKLNHRQ
ncbi:MAG TPA: NUDIX hydrolase [Bacteroidota bacterium]|nr:NUDIX hydrolase [Bacteroidota bacterium]